MANHLLFVISVLSSQQRSRGINFILEHRTLVLCSACVFYRFWNTCSSFAWTQNVNDLCIEALALFFFHFCSVKFEIPTFCLYKAVLLDINACFLV